MTHSSSLPLNSYLACHIPHDAVDLLPLSLSLCHDRIQFIDESAGWRHILQQPLNMAFNRRGCFWKPSCEGLDRYWQHSSPDREIIPTAHVKPFTRWLQIINAKTWRTSFLSYQAHMLCERKECIPPISFENLISFLFSPMLSSLYVIFVLFVLNFYSKVF